MFFAAVLVYLPALAAPFVLDDEPVIAAAASWLSESGSATSGRPVATATLAVNAALNTALDVDQRPDPGGPRKAVGYRLFNLLIHLLTGALLFALLRRAARERTIPDDWRDLADPIAAIVAALWILHPIQSEVVNYIVQRTESLASLCYLGVLYASVRAWDAPSTASRARWYALSIAACIVGMGSKEIVITAPLVVMLYDRAFRVDSWRGLFAPATGRGAHYTRLWAACVASFLVFAAGARGDTAGVHSDVTWYRYLYTQCWAIAHYLRLVAWPRGFAVDYGFTPVRGAAGIPGAVLLSALAVATIAAWTRVAPFGWFAFTGSWFFLLLAPSSSVVPVLTEVAAERRIYLALAAVFVLAVVALESARRRFVSSAITQRTLGAALVGAAAILALVTGARSRTYANTEALWRGTVAAVPDNPRALDQLGWALYRRDMPNFAAAESAFTAAAALDASCHFGCVQLATVLVAEGRLAEAVAPLERAVAGDPQRAPAERDLALVLMKLGAFDRAIPHLEKVATRFPTLDHIVALGVSYASAGRGDEAVEAFRRLALLDGGSAEMRKLSGTLILAARDPAARPALEALAWKYARGWM